MKVVRVIGIVIVLLAIVAAVVPPLYNCSASGKMLTVTTGKQVPMKCYWTAQASIGVAIPLAVVGLLIAFAKRRESARALAVVAIVLGAVLVALPTYLIGTCAAFDMICNLVEKPAMLAAGILTIVLAGVALALSMRPGPVDAA